MSQLFRIKISFTSDGQNFKVISIQMSRSNKESYINVMTDDSMVPGLSSKLFFFFKLSYLTTHFHFSVIQYILCINV